MKTMIAAAVVTLLMGIAGANAKSQSYRAPAHNYYQNNWVGRG